MMNISISCSFKRYAALIPKRKFFMYEFAESWLSSSCTLLNSAGANFLIRIIFSLINSGIIGCTDFSLISVDMSCSARSSKNNIASPFLLILRAVRFKKDCKA